MTPTLHCWLMGSDTLLAECGEILLRDGHAVHGVVASSERIAGWARGRGLPVHGPKEGLAARMSERPFDHLFSITHLSRVPGELLALPARGAINFHDGPLPGYAGLHAPVWALLHGETRYGVTWHEMTPELDAGPILAQRHFDVAPDETARSLNTRCFEAGLDSFGELVASLAAGGVARRPQPGGPRRAFSRHDRPPAACAIDWRRPALEIERLVRALDFGPYPNPVGLPKLAARGVVLAVTRAHLRPAPPAAPGRVLSVDERALVVATGHDAIALTGFTELDGRELSVAEACRRLGLAPGLSAQGATAGGDTLAVLSDESARRLSEIDRRASRAERAWSSRLAALEPAVLPFAADGSTRETLRLEIAVPPGLAAAFPSLPPEDALVAAFCGFVARITRSEAFDLGFRDAELARLGAGAEGFVAPHLPVRVDVHPDETLDALARRLRPRLAETVARGPWLLDLVARTPALRAPARERSGAPLPVSVERGLRPEEDGSPPEGVQCVLRVEGAACGLRFDAGAVPRERASSLARGFEALLESLAAAPGRPLAAHAAASAQERGRQLRDFNRRAVPARRPACVHTLFEAQAARTPESTALACAGRSMTYAQLDERASRFAAALRGLGVGPGSLVGLHLERGLELVVALLGTLKAGGAYLPLDPAFPAERIAFMLEDARAGLVVTQSALADALPGGAPRLLVDAEWPEGPSRSARAPQPGDLAYAIYTSGSTGRPKGVLVEHRNVASFFDAIDERVPHAPGDAWLAVTSLSFDISALELLWTLTRGFKLVIHVGRGRAPARTPAAAARAMEFSLFYFLSDEGSGDDAETASAGGRAGRDPYRLLLEGARFADEHGFSAVWTPERHFHAFGGLYPNPAVTGAAVAAVTRRIAIRAGSVVLPLHHPVRVAEEWAVVDNLSGGRAGISFASGWHPDDFVLAPQNHAQAKTVMLRDIEVVRRLWRGEALPFPGPSGAPVNVRTLPRPVQAELPVWLTSAGNVETWVLAGTMGANVLTHLVGQSVETLVPKIEAYRAARAAAGFDPATGVVSLMLHTFVGEDEDAVRERVRAPLRAYLGSSLSLLQHCAASFPAFQRSRESGADASTAFAALGEEDRAALIDHAADRYYETSGLFGTPARCAATIARLRAAGIDEVACLVDFGLPDDEVLAGLPQLDRVRILSRPAAEAAPDAAPGAPEGDSIAALIRRERITHLQCTPSLARMLCADDDSRAALRSLEQLMVGGEALPADLAAELAAATGRPVTNLYGPTEATIWSTSHAVPDRGSVPIGRPLANTLAYVLDGGLNPLPLGVPGELFLGGEGVVRGYLRRPELDAERFLPDPYAAAPGARMYRTGDLARWREDGVLEFLGRVDQQIKIRGHRIEPGEIESLLVREPSVHEAVVVAREDSPGDQRLLAYVSGAAGALDPARLLERLADQLPAALVPSRIVVLERIPRTPNGKIDRRALPAPGANGHTNGIAKTAAAPSAAPLPNRPAAAISPAGSLPAVARASGTTAARPDEIESRLARIWQEVLGLEAVGADDNFFDRGGHSLLVIQIHRRLREVVARPVSLTDLFRYPTVRSLARFLVGETGDNRRELDEAGRRGERRRAARVARRPAAPGRAPAQANGRATNGRAPASPRRAAEAGGA